MAGQAPRRCGRAVTGHLAEVVSHGWKHREMGIQRDASRRAVVRRTREDGGVQERPQPHPQQRPHRVVVIGGGFGGLNAVQRLAGDRRVEVTLIDRHNDPLFPPRLDQVATGALAPGEIAQPLRSIVRKHPNVTVLLGEAVAIDPAAHEVRLSDGGPIPYDTLVVATGAQHSYFGHDDWAPYAPGVSDRSPIEPLKHYGWGRRRVEITRRAQR